ncbi:MAG TPA: hypothetical protein VG293_10285 [Solirubrobacteraceae bacterium]|jgi:hypothetical protein|nr:hypothetical protein [Solirubrobacteraceae bacterium]
MFRSATNNFALRISDLIDDMLVGDFDYILDGDELYADVDYYRRHPHHGDDLTWTPSAGRGIGPQRAAVIGPKERRPGTVPARAAVCVSSARPSAQRPATAAGRTRAAHR